MKEKGAKIKEIENLDEFFIKKYWFPMKRAEIFPWRRSGTGRAFPSSNLNTTPDLGQVWRTVFNKVLCQIFNLPDRVQIGRSVSLRIRAK